MASAPLLQGTDDPKRITVAMGSGERVFKLDGQEVVLLGGNYVMKAQPYFPPKEIVAANALEMAEGAKAMLYKPPPAKDGNVGRIHAEQGRAHRPHLGGELGINHQGLRGTGGLRLFGGAQ